jgi:histidine ammonia-lyase
MQEQEYSHQGPADSGERMGTAAIELMAAAQAFDLRTQVKPSAASEAA